MNEILMHVVVDCATFFELVDERVLDAKVALEHLEQMKWRLHRLSVGEKAQMTQFILSLAEASERATGKDDRWRSLSDLPQALGLIEDGAEE